MWTLVFIPFGCIPRKRITGSHGRSVLKLLRSCETVAQLAVCEAPSASGLLAWAVICCPDHRHPGGAGGYLTVALIYISLVRNDSEWFSCTYWPFVNLL